MAGGRTEHYGFELASHEHVNIPPLKSVHKGTQDYFEYQKEFSHDCLRFIVGTHNVEGLFV